MSPRQKRLRTDGDESGFPGDNDGFLPSGQIEFGGGFRPCGQNGTKCSLEMSINDLASFASRCSVKMIHEVVSKFDAQKKELVNSIGFGGILYFPPMKQISRKFSLWLMSSVNERNSTINVGQHISMRFSKYDVGHVFGIPSSGKPVVHSGVGTREAKERVIDKYLGYEFKEQRSIKLVQEILERDYGSFMSKEDVDRFKVAFVVFVVSNLFCPSAKYDYASVDYWNAIQDPEDIKNYDWCGFMLARLLEAVSKLKQDIANNIKFPNITGCAIFLQVLYLDSLDLDSLSLPHHTFPRIRVFCFDNIRAMMLTDKNFLRHLKCDCGLPIGKLREASGCIYSWALEVKPDRVESRAECLHAIWETAVAMVHLLGIPLEAAGPVFVAVADFQEQLDSGLFVTGTLAVKFLSVLVTIMIPFTRGFRYQPSYCFSCPPDGEELVESTIINGMRLLSFPIRNRIRRREQSSKGEVVVEDSVSCPSTSASNRVPASTIPLVEDVIGDDVERSIAHAVGTINHLPDYMDVNLSVASVMAKFYSLFRMIKPANDFDLNSSAAGDSSSSSSSTSSDGSVCDNVVSPWDLGYVWNVDDNNLGSMFRRLSNFQKDESMAIVHRGPKYIQVSFRAMCSQFKAACEMEVDLFDALVRVLKLEDDVLFASYGTFRWRHLFESDIMVLILSGSYDLLDGKLRDHLSLSEQSFDLKTCKLVFFPALLQHHWVCFAWHPDRNLISVFDPSQDGRCPDWRCQLIERAAYFLKQALSTLASSVFRGVGPDVRTAELRFLNIAEKPIDRVNRTGVLCSMFIRCYDGNSLRCSVSKAEVELISSKLLEELCDLKGNTGELYRLAA